MSSTEPYDILAIGAHPDDAELFIGGTLAGAALPAAQGGAGRLVLLASLTRGEMGTRGTVEGRLKEAAAAATILGVDHRILELPDGRLADTEEQRLAVAQLIREARPRLIITHAGAHHNGGDRHPDHNAAHTLVRSAAFVANMGRAPLEGERHNTGRIVYFPGNLEPNPPVPSAVVDITAHYERKTEALRAHESQFHSGAASSDDPPTYISSPEYWEWIETRARYYGKLIGAKYGEPLLIDGPLPLGPDLAGILNT